jgi:CRP-like cAMP-binding protein
MFQELDKYLSRCCTLSQEEIELFHSHLKHRVIPKKKLLLEQGQVCNFEAYIIKGCVRKYYVDYDGNEVILQFAIEDWWVSDIASFSEQKPSNQYIETLEDTELLTIDYKSKEFLFERIPGLERLFRIMVQRSYAVLENRFFATVSQTAEERYLDFIKRYPTIPQRVPQHQIASYLGVTPESLSRIKTKLTRER